jgi:hypothetical protein
MGRMRWAAAAAAVLTSVLLHLIATEIRRRREGRPDGIEVISDPEDPAFE